MRAIHHPRHAGWLDAAAAGPASRRAVRSAISLAINWRTLTSAKSTPRVDFTGIIM